MQGRDECDVICLFDYPRAVCKILQPVLYRPLELCEGTN